MFASHASLSAYQWSAFTFGWLLLHRPINSTGWGPVNFTAITFTTAKDYSSSRRAKRFCLTKLTDAAFHRRAAFIHVALVQEAPVRTCLKMPKWNFVIWSFVAGIWYTHRNLNLTQYRGKPWVFHRERLAFLTSDDSPSV